MASMTCPDLEAWGLFARGGVPDDRIEVMARHLEDCRECTDRIARVEEAGRDGACKTIFDPAIQRLLEVTVNPVGSRSPSLGRFRIHECLGMGGLGAVYRAFDPDRGHDVAL